MHTIMLQQHARDLARAWSDASGLSEARLGRVLGCLACWFYVHIPDGAAAEEDILTILAAEWAVIQAQDSAASQAAAFLDAVRQHTELLVERTPGRYAFCDQALQEFYVAQYLLSSGETGMRLIRQHLHEPRWDTLIVLTLALAGEQSPEAATALLETAVLAQGADAIRMGLLPSRHEQLLGRDFLFALRCLAEPIPVLPRLVRPLLERLADQTLRRSGPAAYARYRERLEACLAALDGQMVAVLLPMLISGLRGPAREPRLRAAAALGRLAVPEGVAALRAALEQDDQELRRAAVRALATVGSTVEVVAALRVALDDADPQLRREAVVVLGRFSAAQGVTEALWVALGDSASVVRLEAARALARLGVVDAPVRAVLREGLGSLLASERFLAVRTLGEQGVGLEGVVELLCSAIDDADPVVRRAALRALAGLGAETERVIEALRVAQEHADPVTCIQALGALGHLPGEVSMAVAVLRRWLDADDQHVRQEAVRALGELSTAPEATAALVVALRDPAAGVRREAVRLMTALGVEGTAVTALAALVNDPDPDVYREVFRALGKLDAGATAALSALRLVLDVPDQDMRVAAAGALAALGETSDTLLALALAGLPNAVDWQTRYRLAGYLGRAARPDAPVLDVLLGGLLDRDNTVRQACTAALALLGRRFPDQQALIETRLLNALADTAFARIDRVSKRSGHDFAHEALWRLIALEERNG